MADDPEREAVRWTVRPMLLYPLFGLMALGFGNAVVTAALARDGRGLCAMAAMASIGWFCYRNPALLNGPVWGRIEDFAAADDQEFLLLGWALASAAALVF